jgi:hypothetical protein
MSLWSSGELELETSRGAFAPLAEASHADLIAFLDNLLSCKLPEEEE